MDKEDECELEVGCKEKPIWWLVDQKEGTHYKACNDHKEQWKSDRFIPERRYLTEGAPF